MAHTEIRVTIDRPLSEVFSTYTRHDAFHWSDMRNVAWTKGKPWEVGSRLRIEIQDVVAVTVDQVLTDFKADSLVCFISHFGGVTMQSRVQFRALSDRVTEVHTDLEFVGTFSRMAGVPLRANIERGARRVYEALKRECEQLNAARRRSTRVPLRVNIEALGIAEPVQCRGETVVVNCHGALISTSVALPLRTRIEVRVIPTQKHALADVVHVDAAQPRLCGIGLVRPQNIWGLPLPPPDWLASESQAASE